MTERIAVISLFYKEYFFINLWQNFYGSQFGYEHLYAIGDAKNDTSFQLFDQKVNFIEYAPGYDGNVFEHVNVILDIQKKLLQHYEVVIFAEADQFFVPDPQKYKDLKDYLSLNKSDYIRVSGYNVLHDIINEPIYNPSLPILAQRNWWYKDPGPENKTVIIRKPITNYSTGFHESFPSVDPDPELYNIHLHEYDFNICNSRRKNLTKSSKLHPATCPDGQAFHIFIQDTDLKNNWYKRSLEIGIQEIPDKFKKLF